MVILAIGLIVNTGYAGSVQYNYPVKKADHKGGDITPVDAYKLAKSDAHTFIVDVRSRPEYVLVGHPTMAVNVPCRFWTGKHTSKGYGMALNDHFAQDLKARFNPEQDTLIFMCRSGGRSCDAANLAAAGQWPVSRIFNMMGGFEGDKIKNKESAYHGQRMMGGWKNEGLPWTYKVDTKLAYPEAD